MCPLSRAFDTQLTEIDDLLDARRKLANLCTVAASDGPSATSGKGSSTSCRRPLTPLPSGNSHKSSTAPSAKNSSSSKSSNKLQPDPFAAEEGFSEDGRPYRETISRWMEDVSPAATSSARLSGRGVECRLSVGGKVCEWVIFL